MNTNKCTFGSTVKKGRKEKTCAFCEKKIPIGDSSLTINNYYDGFTHHLHHECYDYIYDEGYKTEDSYYSLFFSYNEDDIKDLEDLQKLRNNFLLKNKIEIFLEMCDNE